MEKPQNIEEYKKWLKCEKDIEIKMKTLKSELSPAQLEEAENFAKNWKPQKTKLTIKVLAGKKESWRIVESAKANITKKSTGPE